MTQIVRMSGANGEGIEMNKYEDQLFPVGVDPIQAITNAEEFIYRQGDIVQCSYPKSGFQWMGNMLWKLKTPDDSAKPSNGVFEHQPIGSYDSQENPRIIPTHFAANRLFPSHIENKGKVVLMLRNPKDVAVSYYHHIQKAIFFQNKQTWDEFFQSFITGETMRGSYLTYLQEWEQVLHDVSEGKSKLEIEVFYYEDFLLEPKENIARLNKFLGFGRDELYLNRVLSETTLDALNIRYRVNSKTPVHPFCTDKEGNSIIFRKGQIGDWKNHLTVAQSDLVDQLLKNTLRHDILLFRYEK